MICQNENVKKIKNWIENLILFFIVFQVIIDLLTTFSVKILQVNVSFGMIVRFAFLLVIAIYVLFYGNKFSKAYGCLLALFMGVQLIYVICSSDAGIFSNARFYLRTAFFPFNLLLFYTFLHNLTEEQRQKKIEQIVRILNFFVFLMGVVFLISFFSQTYLSMYKADDGRFGSQGWFLSGNEISSIMIVLSGIPIYRCYTAKCLKEQLFPAITLILELFTVISLGTKASLFLLAAVLGLMSYSLIWTFIKKRLNIPFTVATVISILLFAVFWQQLPAVQNLQYQYNLQKIINIEASQTENGEVASFIQEKHDAAVWEDTDEYTGSVRLTMSCQSVSVAGYFYPYYVDIGHPDFIEKTLVFVDEDDNRFEFPLTDVYNRYIVNPEESTYSSRYAGLSGEIPLDFFQENQLYRVLLDIKTDDFRREYDMENNLSFNENCFPYEVSYEDGVLLIGEKTSESETHDIESCPFASWSQNTDYKYNLWFSARDNRLGKLVHNRQWSFCDLTLGTGYVANYAELNGGTGLEMDFIEIFITFGAIGFILYFMLYFALIFKGALLNLRKCWLKIISPGYLLFLVPLLISAGSAFAAGHTFLAPSVAFHVSVMTVVFASMNHKMDH